MAPRTKPPRASKPRGCAKRQGPSTDTERRVTAELRGAWLLGPFHLEGIAQQAHDKVDEAIAKARSPHLLYLLSGVIFLPAELIANVNGIIVIEEPHCAQCGLEGTIPGGVFIRATTDAQRRALRILHELAHALLRKRRRGSYTHADVWGLTLMLAIPQRALRHAELCREIPKWARALRRTIARHAERMAA